MAQQYELNLRDYYRIFRRRRITILLIMCVVMGTFYYRLSSQVPVYESSIKVKIIERRPVLGINYGARVGDMIQTQQEIIKSRPVAERAAKDLGWLEGLSDPLEIDRVIQKIQENITTEQIGQASVIRIIATTLKPETARQMVEAVATAYHDLDLEENVRNIKSVRLFVEEELKKAKKKLEKAEETLKQFKEDVFHTERATQLQNEISSLELKLQDLLARATPKHPEVERLQRQLDIAREEIKKLPERELAFDRLTQEIEDNQKLVTQLKQK